MPSLLDLSPELFAATLDILSSNSPTLDSLLLSLSGNHNLLAFVRPYTWRELNVTLSSFKKAELEASSALASRIESFYAANQGMIKILEIEGGDLFEFWRNNTQKDASGATQSDFEDTTISPLSSFLYRNESLSSTLRKLKIMAEWQDVWCFSDFFAHYKEPPAVLKEVFINILMYEDDYQKILLVFAACH
ncbi:hypothetical protein C8J57DRAFT_1710881 [Mycena rebaudengoi]|nr:hypothetical protein C8J57DRAFT_1710881 [Mycena rebaudengoi]